MIIYMRSGWRQARESRAVEKVILSTGQNKSPPLKWQGVPEGTKSFALILEDHDALVGTFTHWAVFEIPADSDGLLEGQVGDQASPGINDFSHDRYDGPKPPKGHGPHRYHFRLVALNVASLGLTDDPDSNAVKNAARARSSRGALAASPPTESAGHDRLH